MNQILMVCGARRSGTTLMAAALCSDPRANQIIPEAQALTRLVEAYHWSKNHHQEFVAPLLGPDNQLKQLYSRWVSEFLDAVTENVPNDGLIVLKHPAMVRVLSSLLDLAPDLLPVVMVRDPCDQVASEQEVAARANRPSPAVDSLADSLASWFESLNTADVSVVRYEDLVGDYTEVKDRLEETFGLRLHFDPAQPWPNLEGLEAMRKYPAWSQKYGMPVDQAGVGRGAAELAREDITRIEQICAGYMQRFGYPRAGR